MAVMDRTLPETDPQAPLVHAVLSLLKARTGLDFTQYRPGTVARRIENRMFSTGLGSLEAYLSHLEGCEEETLPLLERLTIKVSRFYRNPEVFDLLAREILPALARQARGAPLSLWSAGCGCGEEAYTLALLLEAQGIPGTVEATDIDPSALAFAGRGLYLSGALADLPEPLHAFFEPAEEGGAIRHRVSAAVRRRVRFSRHDVSGAAPPPGPPCQLLACRNVLIYFGKEAQARTLARLRSALAAGGYLCLGEAEWPSPAVAATLEVASPKLRLFRAPDGEKGGVPA